MLVAGANAATAKAPMMADCKNVLRTLLPGIVEFDMIFFPEVVVGTIKMRSHP